nr:hypothetical protein [Streptomyces sp. TML10]
MDEGAGLDHEFVDLVEQRAGDLGTAAETDVQPAVLGLERADAAGQAAGDDLDVRIKRDA